MCCLAGLGNTDLLVLGKTRQGWRNRLVAMSARQHQVTASHRLGSGTLSLIFILAGRGVLVR
jgi:hypothetical protein